MELYHQKSPSIDYGGRKRLTDWVYTSTRKRPLPSYRNGRGGAGCASLILRKYKPDTLYTRSVKTDWQCRPGDHNNHKFLTGQFNLNKIL